MKRIETVNLERFHWLSVNPIKVKCLGAAPHWSAEIVVIISLLLVSKYQYRPRIFHTMTTSSLQVCCFLSVSHNFDFVNVTYTKLFYMCCRNET